jgi:hypothetical protein
MAMNRLLGAHPINQIHIDYLNGLFPPHNDISTITGSCGLIILCLSCIFNFSVVPDVGVVGVAEFGGWDFKSHVMCLCWKVDGLVARILIVFSMMSV